MKLVIFLTAALVSSAVFAQDRYSWGTTIKSDVVFQKSTACVAEVVIRNRVSEAAAFLSKELTLEEITVTFNMVAGAGNEGAPDEFRLDVPEGFYAMPKRISLEDNTVGKILVCSADQLVG